MRLSDRRFHRLFSKTMYKDLKLLLGEMTFTKDFVTDRRGDLYPVIEKSADCTERVADNRYTATGGRAERLLGQFFPFATYEVTFDTADGGCGFIFHLPHGQAAVVCRRDAVTFTAGEVQEAVTREATGATTLIVSCRPGAFDVYFLHNGQPRFFTTFTTALFAESHAQAVFENGFVSLAVEGDVSVTAASFYIDCGVSQADIRPIRYENGEVMTEGGRVYLTLSVRMQEEMFQGIVSWVPGTAEFALTGALFYDSGDGKWCGDVAASLLFDRNTRQWLLWVCSFAHGHVLGHAAFGGDPRFGVNVVDITLMETVPNSDLTAFCGQEGDEDPDFYYNERENTWYMAICRLDPQTRSYKYVFFRSDKPFEGYTCIGCGQDGAETGGSFVTVEGETCFVCGNGFDRRANYRIYTADGMREATFDFDDGGFRGWGTVLPLPLGSRTRYFWLTFDRHNGSHYNWSYGNLYGFEGIAPQKIPAE